MLTVSSIEQQIKAMFADVVYQREEMHVYQDESSEFLRLNPFSGLFVDMGLGKTVSAGTVIADILSEFLTDDPVLIIGPLKVATTVWPDEFRAWNHLAPFSTICLREDDDDPRLAEARKVARAQAKIDAEEFELDKAQAQSFCRYQEQKAETAMRQSIREENARSRCSIHIVPREHVEWLVYFWGPKWPYRTVIIDESSSFKDHQSNRYLALAKVRNTSGLITRLHILTATPAAETYLHLFSQIFLLDRGASLGKSITHYRNRYFIHNRYNQKYELRPGAEEEILEKIKHLCLVLKRKDYLPSVDPLIVERPVHLTATQMEMYKTMQRDMVLTLDTGEEIEAATAAALSAKLLQMASGVLYDTYLLEDYDTGDMKKVRKVYNIHDHKIEALKEILEEAETQGEKIAVAYHHKSSLDRLKKAFPKAVVMDREGKAKKAWNAGKIDMLLLHPQSAGHGLNLQHGGHILVFFDLHASLENYLQVIGRFDRQGQKHRVVIMMIVAKGTRDEDTARSLRKKEDAQEKFFMILKRLIREYRKSRVAMC